MKFRTPTYYPEFSCIADACPETCCAGWAIVIDEETMKRYHALSGEIKTFVNAGVDEEEQTYLQRDGRCYFLNADKLCDLQCRAGETYLCKTCARYPRHFEEYGNLVEGMLSMSCPVAVTMIMSRQEKDSWVVQTLEKKAARRGEVDGRLLRTLLLVRERIFEIVSERSDSLYDRMRYALTYTEKIQTILFRYQRLGVRRFLWMGRSLLRSVCEIVPEKKTSEVTCSIDRLAYMSQYMSMLSGLEIIDTKWSQMLHDAYEELYCRNAKETYTAWVQAYTTYSASYTYEYEHILNYFIDTYFLGGVYDYNILGMMKMAVYHTMMIWELHMEKYIENGSSLSFEERVYIAYRYSRQVEHSDENLMAIEGLLSAHPMFRVDILNELILR